MRNKFTVLILLSVSFIFCQSLITDIEKDSLGTISKISYYKDTKSGIVLIREKSFFEDGRISSCLNLALLIFETDKSLGGYTDIEASYIDVIDIT